MRTEKRLEGDDAHAAHAAHTPFWSKAWRAVAAGRTAVKATFMFADGWRMLERPEDTDGSRKTRKEGSQLGGSMSRKGSSGGATVGQKDWGNGVLTDRADRDGQGVLLSGTTAIGMNTNIGLGLSPD